MGKIKPMTIISGRDGLSLSITKYWNIIKSENLIDKRQKRNYDLKEVYKKICEMAEQRVIFKLKQQCFNMGMHIKDLPADANIINVFKLTELNERKVQLMKIRTLDPKLKAKKGKRNLTKTEVFTSDLIKKEIQNIDLAINEIKLKMDEFNNRELEDATPLVIAA